MRVFTRKVLFLKEVSESLKVERILKFKIEEEKDNSDMKTNESIPPSIVSRWKISKSLI